MIKILHDKRNAKETITDEYDNTIFEIYYNGAFIGFKGDFGYDFNYITPDEQDTIINYLIGIACRYEYKYNAFEVYRDLQYCAYQQY